MGELYTEIEIKASAKRVWEILIDFEQYAQWNPFLISACGELRIGFKLKVCAHPSGSIARIFFPTIQKIDTNRELRWLDNSWQREFLMVNIYLPSRKLTPTLSDLFIAKTSVDCCAHSIN